MNFHGGYSGEQQNVIDFSVNVNPLPLERNIKAEMKRLIEHINRYPEIDGQSALKVLAHSLGIEAENVILGNGATELIYLYARALKYKKVMIVTPCYNEYKRAFKQVGSEIVNFASIIKGKYILNVEKLADYIKRYTPNLVVICNPNNPTGQFVEYSKLEMIFDLCKRKDIDFFVDESFIDFTPYLSAVSLIDEYPVFVIHSMTKFESIPGLRLGYAVGKKDIIQKMNAIKEPWTINSIALGILPKLIEAVGKRKAKTHKWLLKERKFLKSELGRIDGITYIESCTNFFLLKHRYLEGCMLKEKLLSSGIYIRECYDFESLEKDFVRIAIMKHADNVKLIKALKKL